MVSPQQEDETSLPLWHYNAKYMGQHTEYPTPKWTSFFINRDKIILQGKFPTHPLLKYRMQIKFSTLPPSGNLK